MTESTHDEFGLERPRPLEASPLGKVHSGDEIHFLKSTLAWGSAWARGDSLQLTPQQIAESVDGRGRSWLDQVGEPDARIALGPWPQGQDVWLPGSTEESAAYEAARREAHALPLAADRAQALSELARRFPHRGGPTSVVLANYDGGAR